MSQDQHVFHRATTAALIGLGTQFAILLATVILALYSGSRAISAAMWYMLGGLPIWTILWILYNQHRLERLEAMDAEELARTDARSAAIFADGRTEFADARRKLERIYKIGLNVVAILTALYLLLLGGGYLYSAIKSIQEISAGTTAPAVMNPMTNLTILLSVFAGMCFIIFLIARYIAGMTVVPEWTALRSGASYLMGNLLALILLTGSVIWFMAGRNDSGFRWLEVIIPSMMILLGIEMILSLVFGMYRPRKPGEFVRPAFDSRVLGLLTRPESIGKIISETVNYQFGFEISTSWFYQLLSRAMAPLILVCILLVLLMTSVVIVAPEQEAVVMRFGKIVGGDTDDQSGVLGPGLHFKLPWPIESVEKVDRYRVHQVVVGSRMEGEGELDDTPILWASDHDADMPGMSEDSEKFLVTAPTSTDASSEASGAAAGELIGADIVVKYQISNALKYVSEANDPDAMLEAISAQKINEYFATKDIDTLLASGREAAGDDLRQAMNDAVSEANIGLEVVFVSISGIHPPQKEQVAESFHQQITALQERETTIQSAMRERVETLSRVAGSPEMAERINTALQELNALKQQRESKAENAPQSERDALAELITQKEIAIEQILDETGGEAAQKVLVARADRWDKVLNEKGAAARFLARLEAYRVAPRVYTARAVREVEIEARAGQIKQVIVPRKGTQPKIRLNAEQEETTNLRDVIGSGN